MKAHEKCTTDIARSVDDDDDDNDGNESWRLQLPFPMNVPIELNSKGSTERKNKVEWFLSY